MNKYVERLYNGIIKENPTFVMMLGMCPTLAVTTSAINGLGMGLTTTAILVASNVMISMLRKVIPDKVRIPAFIVVVASFVTIVQFLLQAYLPSLNESLGIYIPLIVVNCIILGRAESYASKNPVFLSLLDGLGMGLGFTVGLTAIGIFREILGAGTIFGLHVMPKFYTPATIFILAPGAFFVLAGLIAIQNAVKEKKASKNEGAEVASTCKSEDCAHCANSMCGGKIFTMEEDETPVKVVKSGKDVKKDEKDKQPKKTDQKKQTERVVSSGTDEVKKDSNPKNETSQEGDGIDQSGEEVVKSPENEVKKDDSGQNKNSKPESSVEENKEDVQAPVRLTSDKDRDTVKANSNLAVMPMEATEEANVSEEEAPKEEILEDSADEDAKEPEKNEKTGKKNKKKGKGNR